MPATVDELCQAITKERIGDVRRLLKSPNIKDIINSSNKEGVPPLFHGISVGDAKIFKLLLQHVDLNMESRGELLLNFAEKENRVEIMELLLQKGAKVISPSDLLVNAGEEEFDRVEKWMEILDIAVKNKCNLVINLLIKIWGKINAQDAKGATVLHCSSILRVLLILLNF